MRRKQQPGENGRARLGSSARPMIAYRQTPQAEFMAQSESPAILRLRLLEMTFAVEGPLPDAARQSAYDLIGALKRAIAEKPSLTFADVVAKLKTFDEMADDRIGEPMDA